MKGNKILLISMALVLALSTLAGSFGAAFASTPTNVREFKVTSGKPVDVFFGRNGVSSPSSVFSGNLVLTREAFDLAHNPKQGLAFLHWMDVRLYDLNDKEIKQSRGFMYLYFNLNSAERKAYDNGDLKIYFWDSTKDEWSEALTILVHDDSSTYGRIATVINQFGLYGLGEK